MIEVAMSLMECLMILVVFIILTSFFYVTQNTTKNGSTKHPPGPRALPVIGNLHQFDSSFPYLSFYKLSKIHGPIMYLRLGFMPTVVISSARLAKEVLKTHDHIFCSRPKLTTHQKLSYNGSDVGFSSYGDSWREAKKQCILHLLSIKKVQSFGLVREQEVRRMITEKISSLAAEGRTVNLSEMMMSLSTTVLCIVSFGRSYEAENARCGRSFRAMIMNAQEMLITYCFSDTLPFMGWVDKLTGMSSRLHRVFMELDCFYEEIIQEHRRKSSLESEQDMNFVDFLLKLQSENDNMNMNHVKGILMNVFLGGSETSPAVVVWAMTELMKNPDTMMQLQQETRTFIKGNENGNMIIKEEDLEKLVYLKAVVKETLRMHPVLPLLLPHQTMQKCNIEGYEIEEKTLVYVSAWAIGRDPQYWEDPDEFKPERFLNDTEASDFRGQDFDLIPFGSGRRSCPGMYMGLTLLELALANLVCSFDWALPVSMEKQVLDTSTRRGIAAHKQKPLFLMAKNYVH